MSKQWHFNKISTQNYLRKEMQLYCIRLLYVLGSILKLEKITLCKLVSNQRIEREIK